MELVFPAAARDAGHSEVNALTEELLNKEGLPCAAPSVNGNELPLVMRKAPEEMLLFTLPPDDIACCHGMPSSLSFLYSRPAAALSAGRLSEFQSYRRVFQKLPGDSPVF